jgi:serine/threonine protein kinase
MSPEEYRQAAALFDRLRDLPETERTAALERVSAGLRADVLRLLLADVKAANASFLGRGAMEDAARLITPDLPSPGATIGNYRLGRRIGAGGMGIVYEGHDLHLNRRVALKILTPPAGEEAAERLHRFQREARAASLLNHPNIVSIFDAGQEQGFNYIATEFIEGETLRQLVTAQPRGLDARTLLDVITQTASALRAAHDAGIVHRDIKPENIMLRPDGFVKVLDFGLAKLGAAATTSLQTRPGNLAGTIQYLSPEQVAGKTTDHRSDLFSLGVVAYELATGTRPFEGPTDGAIYEAILNRAPKPPSSLRAELNPNLDALILRCLEKDPELRFQTAGDLRSACLGLSRDPAPPPRRSRWRGRAAAVAVVCLGAAAIWYFARVTAAEPASPLPTRFQRLTNSPGEESSPSLSADGKQLVYASRRSGNWDIYFQRTGGGTSFNVTRNYAEDDTQPAFSPDGSRIAFRSEREGGGLYVMEATGENPRRVSQRGYFPAWAPGGRHMVYSTHTFDIPSIRAALVSRLMIVDLQDGTERTLKTEDAIQPSWSPHGQRIAYWGVSAGGRRDIFTVAASGDSEPLPVTADEAIDWRPVWSLGGEYLYFLSNRGGTMNAWRVAIDERTGIPKKPPEPVTLPAQSVGGLSLGGNGASAVYSQASQRNTLAKVGFDPVSRAVTGTPQPVAAEHAAANFSFSPDGTKLVADTLGEVSEELWIMNSDGAERRLLVGDAYRNRVPQWSPDGEEILFLSDRSGQYGIWVIRKDGSGLRPLTTPQTPAMQRAAWSPDGSRVLAGRSTGPSLLLDALAPAPSVSPAVAPGLQDGGYLLFYSWTSGPGGGLALAQSNSSVPAPEVVVYSVQEGRLEHTGLAGRPGGWLPAGSRHEPPHRYFLFFRESEVFLYDRSLKRETRILSTPPDTVYAAELSPNGRWIYFTKTVRDADLWLAQLGR